MTFPEEPGVLDALAARFAGGGADSRSARSPRQSEIPPEADGVVRAMPVILRIERDPRPDRTALLEAAAEAAVAVCLDERAAPGGPWYDAVRAWTDGRIRKIARRARGAHWRAVQDIDGVTVAAGGGDPGSADPGRAEVRALLPGPVDDVPREVSRLQIGGTDLEPERSAGGTRIDADDPGRPLIVLNPRVEMSLGKAAAQVGHASMILTAVRGWTRPAPFAVRVAGPAEWDALLADVERGAAVAVRDAGLTEVDPGTVTCIARPGPGAGLG